MDPITEADFTVTTKYKMNMVSRVITLPSVKYSGQVETDVFESRLGQGETGREPAFCENNN